MANIAKTGVTIVTKAAGFVSGLRSANNAYKGFNRQTSRGAKNWSRSMGASFAATIAKITILTLSLRRVMRTILSEFKNLDEARKFAQSIGQAGEFATDKLLAFEFAAKRVGASSSVARTGLRTMSKAIGEAQLGMGEGTQALRILGLDARKLGTMLPTEAFLEISKAMNKMENASLRTASAQKIFGRAGVRMLNLARLSGKSIEELITRHKRLAGVLSEGDIAGVEATNDALGDLVTAYKGLQRQLISSAAPSLFTWLSVSADILAKMRSSARRLGGVINNFMFKALKNVAIILPGIIGLFSGIGTAIWNGVKAVMIMADLFGGFMGTKYDNPLESFSVGISMLGELIKELPNLAEASFSMIKSLASGLTGSIGLGISKVIEGFLSLLKRVAKGTSDFIGMLSIIPGFEDLEEEAKKMDAMIDKAFAPFMKGQEDVQSKLKADIDKSADALIEGWNKFNRIIDRAESKGTDRILKGKAGIEALIAKYKKMFDDIVKGATEFTPDKLSKPPSDGDKKSKEQFGAFAELGSQEASRLLADVNEGDEIQREQLGVLRTLVQVVRTGNDEWRAFINNQDVTGGVVTR